MENSSRARRLLPDPQVCKRYGVTPMTLWRWDQNPRLEFPDAIRINGRKYRDEAQLEVWERQRAAAQAPATPLMSELRRKCRERGIATSRSDTLQTLKEKLAASQHDETSEAMGRSGA